MTSAELVAANPAAALEALDPSVRELAVTRYLTDARNRLVEALDATGPQAVAAIKAEIATAAEATKQLGLSKEIQTDAQEMVRRAEFALGKAIRAGQEAGAIRTVADGGPKASYERLGKQVRIDPRLDQTKISPKSFVTNGQELHETYAMSDGVSGAEFDAALADARDEGNLSRANVVRKVRGVKQDGLTPVERLRKIRELAPTGMTSQQIAREIGVGEEYVRKVARQNSIDIPADRVMRGTRRLDHTRFVNETVVALEGLAAGLDVLDLSQVDQERISDWSISLTDSLRALNRLAKHIKEMDQ